MHGGKYFFRLFYQTMSLATFTTLTSLDYSVNVFQIKPINLSLNLSKIRITDLAVAHAIGNKLPLFVNWEGQKATVLQEHEVFTLSLQKSMKKSDGWSIAWTVGQRDGQEICFWRKRSCVRDWQLPCPFSNQEVKFFFLPLNTISQSQPLDQGVICSLKAQ